MNKKVIISLIIVTTIGLFFYLFVSSKLERKPDVSALQKDLNSSLARTRAEAAYKLGSLHDSQFIPLLEKHIDDPDERVRYQVVVSLANLGSPSGYQELINLLTSRDIPFSEKANISENAKGLLFMHHETAFPFLIKNLNNEKFSNRVKEFDILKQISRFRSR